MADGPDDLTTPTDDPDGIDPGSPIDELLGLDDPTTEEFLRGVRRRINRRDLAANTVHLSIFSISEVFLSYLGILVESIFPKKKETPDG